MSLNLFVAPVGPSGAGKGAAEAAARDGFHFTGPLIEVVPLGSGEGIGRTFRPAGTKPEEPNPITAAIFVAPEIDTLAAIASRQGSTLSAELRKVYSGEPLGFANGQAHTRNIVTAGSYRACLSLGVQPLRSQPLLNASDGGLPQRFVWLPTSDPDAPDNPPEHPGIWTIRTPAWLRAAGNTVELTVPDAAIRAIRSHRLAVLREDSGVDPLDGHALLTRLKVAAALMALDGRTIVADPDWNLAGYIMDVSNYTRERCRSALVDHSRSVNTARALATAERDEIISERKHQRCKEGIMRALSRVPGSGLIPHNRLRRSLKSDVRDYFDAACADLIDENRVAAVQTPKGMAYGRPPVDDESTPDELGKHGVDHQSTVDQKHNTNPHRNRGDRSTGRR